MRVSVSPSVHAKKAIHTVVLLVLALIVMLAGFAGSAAAQIATGTINGTVTDPKGLAVEGASVTINNTDTGATTPATTNDVGRYVAPLLQSGHYEVTVSKDGFATVLNKDITLIVGQTVTIDVQMPLQTQQGAITVTAATPLLDTEKTEQSQSVSENLVSNLPIVSRRWENFVLLTPGVTTDGTGGLSSFRGISALYNNNSVDGANNTQAFFSEARGRSIIVTYVYSPDSIKEFEVSGGNYTADVGQAAGGTVNAITRSGSNELHGDAFYNLRYPTLNALDPVAIVSAAAAHKTAAQTTQQQNQFGASVGAPIIKDKLFLFATYDGFRKVNPIQYTSSTPGISALSCPAQASPAQCTAAQGYLLSQLGSFQRNLKQEVYFGKLDYQLNQANHLSAVLNIQNWDEPFGYNTSATVSNGGASQNGFGATHERFFIANWNTTISSNKLNEFRFQWGRDFEFDTTNSGGPAVSLTNIASYGETSALPRPAFPDEHRYQFSDNFSVIKGNHTFKFGADVNFIHELLINLFQGDGSYSYNNPTLPASVGAGCLASSAQKTFCGWVADVFNLNLGDTQIVTINGTPTVLSLTGKHYVTFTQVNDAITGVGKDDFYDDDYSAYVQDTWKVRPNITLNLGVRYDIQVVPAPPKPNASTPLLQLYTSTLNNDGNNFAPRIGVAWNPSPKTVVRAGYGMFYGKTSNSTYYALRVENGVYQVTYSGCGPGANASALQLCAPLFPNVFFTPPGPALAAPFAGAVTPVIQNTNPPLAAQAVHGMTPDFVSPVVHSATLSYERELPGGLTFAATYLLSRGEHLPSSYDANVAPATTTRSYDIINSTGTTQSVTQPVPFYTNRLNPLTGIILNQYSVINTWYNGLVLTVRKPMSHGVEVLANYTLSLAKDNGQTTGTNGTFFGTDGVLDPYNLRGDYSHSDLDQRHRLVTSVVWSPNYGRDFSSRAIRMLVDDWSVSGILTVASGQPYTATFGTFTPSGGVDGGVTGGAVSTFASSSGSRVPWLPRNSYNLPGWANIDFRISRGFTFRERYHFMVQADAFNLFNSTIVSAVNTQAYSETNASATSNTCWNGTGAVPAGYTGPAAGHLNNCISTTPTFQSRTTTTGTLYGARQLQIGARFVF